MDERQLMPPRVEGFAATVANLQQDKHVRAGASSRNYINYLPDYHLAVCACPKCGTTSLYKWIYTVRSGKDWDSFCHGCKPAGYVQDVRQPRWDETMTWAKDGAPSNFFESPPEGALSVAFVREPVSRLISAWKDKLACGLVTSNYASGASGC